uniref:Putative secreted protein n=1 Tax=Ixodes ricinus TaxID=34613 RepID=A0A6B0UBF5_IXORI
MMQLFLPFHLFLFSWAEMLRNLESCIASLLCIVFGSVTHSLTLEPLLNVPIASWDSYKVSELVSCTAYQFLQVGDGQVAGSLNIGFCALLW